MTSPLLSPRANQIATRIIERGNARRCRGDYRPAPFEQRYHRICELAMRKYPYTGGNPAWVSEGGLD